ncbi:MAG: Glycosyl hydrolase family 20, catalytic domain [candidate division TA06 bacterium ADurb.Bin131]|uniref:Glycosyl hydrolase family 20, catalytic domain n=1 Tax=candidate division TA06 bacterium ADurb.Bin131 TaxID=1852827 RepID=A0A1V6C8D9_UNCT6|nr:MAG: Glycosyl hydrolase family 20, catalytic domain [candidate division TA06 bacterium ADurb.Bin131]
MKEKFFSHNKPVVAIRGIHLDLKGLPPTPERLFEVLDLAYESRINCLLVEWEDTYPWKIYPELKNQTAYSTGTIRKFLDKARNLNIEIIPLVQSFGHMENVLSKKRFKNLREVPDNVSDLCPLKKESHDTILKMIKDILTTHKNIRYFHLGGDEVWSFGSCEKCKKFVEKYGTNTLYLYHLEPIFRFLKSLGIRPIIWDDMIRKWKTPDIKKISKLTDLMCWSYGVDPLSSIGRDTLNRFEKTGCTIWLASAYKGADGAFADVPNTQLRVVNMKTWMEYAKKNKVKGVVATGWSRYNTFLSPCEGIEAGLDCFVLAGKIIWDGSISENPTIWAENFLKHCQKKGIHTDHFYECRKVSEQMQNMRDLIFSQARNFLQQAHLVGEPERVNPIRAKEARESLLKSLKGLRQCAKEWEKAHAGVIPKFWIKKYILSRVEPAKKIIKLVLTK